MLTTVILIPVADYRLLCILTHNLPVEFRLTDLMKMSSHWCSSRVRWRPADTYSISQNLLFFCLSSVNSPLADPWFAIAIFHVGMPISPRTMQPNEVFCAVGPPSNRNIPLLTILLRNSAHRIMSTPLGWWKLTQYEINVWRISGLSEISFSVETVMELYVSRPSLQREND